MINFTLTFYSAVELLFESQKDYCTKLELEIDMLRCVDEDGNTPLHLACTHGYEEVALYLMQKQPDTIGARYNNDISVHAVYRSMHKNVLKRHLYIYIALL